MNLKTPPLTETKYSWYHHTPPKELIVVCVNHGTKYPDDYVRRLRNMVEMNLTIPHRFICLADHPIDGVDVIPCFAKNWPGWWQKVSLFMPKMFPAGTNILYLDLDVVIVDDLDFLVQQVTDDPLIMIYNFGPNRSHAAHNSSVMMWTAGDPRVNGIYDLFNEKVIKSLHGDQCWIWRVLQSQISNWPQDTIYSYKYSCRGKPLPDNARIVIFHGDPKPHECNEPWVKFHWK